MLNDVHTGARRPLSVCPVDPVMASRGPSRVIGTATYRVPAATAEVELRAMLLCLLRTNHVRVRATRRVEHRPGPFPAHAGLGMHQPHESAGGMHDPTAGFLFEPFVHIHAVLVEAHRLRDPVVGANDRGVPSTVTGADVVRFNHSNVGDPMAGCQVVRRR